MAYIGVSPSNGVRRVHTYTATASQTTFSGAGAEGTSLSYKDSNFVDVYQNGIKLGDADYTSTSGTSIVLAQGASVSDLVVVVVFDVFSVADTVSKADGGTFDGAVTLSGGVSGDTTFTGAITGTTATLSTADNDPQLILKSTDADGDRGPVVQFTRDSASPADDDILGRVQFLFDNDAGEVTTAVQMEAAATDVSNGTEDSSLNIVTMQSGATSSRMKVNSSETVFNDDSKDVDFRVESDGNANMFVVDAGLNAVSIGSGGSTGYQLKVARSDGSAQQLISAATNFNSTIAFGDQDANTSGEIIYAHNGDSMRFHTNATERVRINSNGYFHVSQDISDSTFYDATYTNSFSHSATQNVLFVENSGDGNVYGMVIDFTDATPDNHTSYFMLCQDNSVDRFRIWADGDVVNHDNSYGSTSDIKLKEQIKDASSQWEDVKALKIRKYKMKEDVAKGDSDAHWRLGVIAQELETAGMNGLVKDDADLETNSDGEIVETGTTTKVVKYSILYMKAVKALQEAMTRIEALEAKVTALENAE